MVRILVVGDTHFKPGKLEQGMAFVSACLAAVEKLTPDVIVCLGDTLHTNNIVHVQAHKLACEWLASLSRRAPTFLLIGNHDLISHRQFLTDNHIFNPLKKWAGLTVVDRPIVRDILGLKFGFCPYVPKGKFTEALDLLLDQKTSFHWQVDLECIFAHQEFRGCSKSSVVSSDGDEWSLAFPPVISGHIHEAQDLLEDNVYYPGSVFQHTFGEKKAKHIWLVTFGLDSSVPFRRQYVSLGLKQKIFQKVFFAQLEAFDPSCFKDAEGKLEITGTCVEAKVFRASALHKELKEQGIKVTFRITQASDQVAQEKTQKTFIQWLDQLVIESPCEQTTSCYAELKSEMA